MIKRVCIVINPAAGQDRPFLGIFNKFFNDAQIDWDICVTKKAGDGTRLARQAVKDGYDAVASFGGDGTVMEVANGLIGSQVPLAILPGGTANVMSFELGIPNTLEGALALLNTEISTTRKVDMGQIGERHFLLRAGMGFEADYVEQASRELKDKIGSLAYGVAALNALREPTISHYQLTLDGKEIENEGMTCFVANSGSLGQTGLSLAPSIDVSDGLLDVIVINKADLGSILGVMRSVVTHNEDESVLQHWQAREINVVADPPQSVQMDGEIIGQTPLHVKVIPEAVNIIIPKPVSTPAETPSVK
ncbi:MAG: diacylglycerol kinase family protein [Chloroflexota bacterium]